MHRLGSIIINDQSIAPVSVLAGLAEYPAVLIQVEIWQGALEARVPPKFIEVNRAAFNTGYNL